MNLKNRVKVLDEYVAQGKLMEAIDAFFHPDVLTLESDGLETDGIANTKNKLRAFTRQIERFNKVTLHSQTVGSNVTMSEFTFDLTKTNGSRIIWKEIIRRKWLDGLVINEKYYTVKQFIKST